MAESGSEILSQDSRIIFISGYGGGEVNETEVQQNCWQLTSLVYNLSERDRCKMSKNLLYVVNESKKVGETSSKNIRQIHQMLLDMPVSNKYITRVLIAHSHGASLLYEALKIDSLRGFMKERGTAGIEDTIERIRLSLAVFTLGGMQSIPKSYAKICWNMRFTNDVLAKGLQKGIGDKHGERINTFYAERTSSDLEKATTGSAASTVISAFNAIKAHDAAEGSRASSATGMESTPMADAIKIFAGSIAKSSKSTLDKFPHLMQQYLESEEIVRKIIEILGTEKKSS